MKTKLEGVKALTKASVRNNLTLMQSLLIVQQSSPGATQPTTKTQLEPRVEFLAIGEELSMPSVVPTTYTSYVSASTSASWYKEDIKEIIW